MCFYLRVVILLNRDQRPQSALRSRNATAVCFESSFKNKELKSYLLSKLLELHFILNLFPFYSSTFTISFK